jgi:hypothetical protein
MGFFDLQLKVRRRGVGQLLMAAAASSVDRFSEPVVFRCVPVVLVGDQILIVDPRTLRIVAVIPA